MLLDTLYLVYLDTLRTLYLLLCPCLSVIYNIFRCVSGFCMSLYLENICGFFEVCVERIVYQRRVPLVCIRGFQPQSSVKNFNTCYCCFVHFCFVGFLVLVSHHPNKYESGCRSMWVTSFIPSSLRLLLPLLVPGFKESSFPCGPRRWFCF